MASQGEPCLKSLAGLYPLVGSIPCHELDMQAYRNTMQAYRNTAALVAALMRRGVASASL